MVDFAEHVYHDDPGRGHPDGRTCLQEVSYFLLGNGRVQAAVQWAPAGDGTPLGLLVMNPERLGPKRDAATFDPATGLSATMVRLEVEGIVYTPSPARLSVLWAERGGVPVVEARWDADSLRVTERFLVPDRRTPTLARELAVENLLGHCVGAVLRTGAGSHVIGHRLDVPAAGTARVSLAYTLDPATDDVRVVVRPGGVTVDDAAARWWNDAATLTTGDATIDRFFLASRCQLAAAVSAGGRLDGSIWQYNREWARDQALVAAGLTMAGHRDLGAVILGRLLREFVTPDGAMLDSSEVRTRDDVELDQNGVLLSALERYAAWTGDLALVERAWDRVTRVAEFPLRPEFRHEASGLLHNSREFWERHAGYGIEPGFELVYQVFTVVGLEAAGRLAAALGHHEQASRWDREAARLRGAILSPGPWALWDRRGFVKRRRLDGSVQETTTAGPFVALPPAVPLASSEAHLLNPDTCAVLPILFGFIPPDDPLALRTLASMEGLWNLAWEGGGFGRYHVSSEPDSPGPWPFASLFVARASMEAGDTDRAERVLDWLDTVPGSAAASWFEFYGERVAPPFPQVGVTPWTWAELVGLVIEQLLGVRPRLDCLLIRPRLLPRTERVEATVRVRNARLRLHLRRDTRVAKPAFFVDGRATETAGGELRVPHTDRNLTVEVLLPAASPAASRG